MITNSGFFITSNIGIYRIRGKWRIITTGTGRKPKKNAKGRILWKE
jgi:hypothetical protein